MLTNHPKILTLLTFIGFVMLLLTGNASAGGIGVVCDGDSHCSGNLFLFIGMEPGEVANGLARAINFGDKPRNVLVYHRQEIMDQTTGCGLGIANYSDAISGAAA